MSEQVSAVNDKTARSLVGTVVSNKMDKTIVVMVQRRVKHPLYGKYITKSTKLKAHDESNIAAEGDTVSIEESRPFSKLKTWKLARVIETAPV
jgi:small subunit ribosomal protein S17